MDALYGSYKLFLEESVKNPVGSLLMMIIISGLSIPAMLLLQVILHELGHLILGLFTGYRFLAFRIYSYVLLRQEGRWKIKRHYCPGSAGQCIMLPPTKGRKAYRLHVMGGVIFNALLSLITVQMLVSSPYASFFIRLVLLIFAFYGLCFTLGNGIPIRSLRIINDGSVFIDLWRNPVALDCYYRQLGLAEVLIESKTYKEVPYKVFQVPKDADLKNEIVGYHKILESYYFMDIGQWDKARSILSEFGSGIRSRMIRQTASIERLFIYLMTENISDINDSPLLEAEKCFRDIKEVNIFRVFMAYKIYREPEIFNKKLFQHEIQTLEKNYLYKGEIKFCRSMINTLLDKEMI